MIDLNFKKGCALIVGGSGGIGSLCAQEFANSDAKVAITYYKNEQAAVDLANEINSDVKIYQLDNSDPKSVEETFFFFTFSIISFRLWLVTSVIIPPP